MFKEKFEKGIKILFWMGWIIGTLIFLIATREKTWTNYALSLLVSFMYSFGYGLSNGLLNDFLDQKYPWLTHTKQRAITAIIGTLLLNFVMTYLLNYINLVMIQRVPSQDFFSSKYNFTNWFFINLALMVTAFMHARGFMLAMKEHAKEKIEEQKVIANTASAQFTSLKNQLDPHFLFNSLNVLDALIDEDPKKAQKFTHQLSKVYRYVLEQKDKEKISVQQELDFAKVYSELMKMRFEESLKIDLEQKNSFSSVFVVPLSLQLLLENAMKHNFATANNPLMIKVYQENNYLVVENNIQEREKLDHRQGIGLANIENRYALQSPNKVIIEKSETYFKVKLPLLEK